MVRATAPALKRESTDIHVEPILDAMSAEPSATLDSSRALVIHKSRRNAFGIVRAYRIVRGSVLTHDPDQAVTLTDLTDSTSTSMESSDTSRGRRMEWGPFPNKSAFSLADWYWESRNKSFTDFQKLISILKQPDFSITDTTNVNWKSAFRSLGANREDIPEHEAEWIHDDGWKLTPVTIDVPFHHRMRKPGMDSYLAGSFRHRSLVSVIKEKICNPKDNGAFHYQPYEATWKPTDDAPEVELYGELYASRAFRQAHEEVEALPITDRNKGLERVVVAMMFWSDGTQLTSFGGASLWPCYLFFGNESKYRRCRPSERLGEQVAYFMKVC